jgi:uncharacterized SAM-binding protein YcdF (DUF218 family)
MKALAGLLVIAMLWATGLLAFAARVARSTPAPDPGRAQGIVALTGGSNQRLQAAMDLLQDARGRRLLISGVYRKTTREDVRHAARAVDGPIYDCCVDLGFEAIDTLGNARETAEWARARGYSRLILVTADYHMPRALLELKGAMPKVRLTPYPVQTGDMDARIWWKSPQGLRLMALEYSKYLVILAREAVLNMGPRISASGTPGTSATRAGGTGGAKGEGA